MGLFNRPRAPEAPKEPETKPEEKPAALALTKEDVAAMIKGATEATAQQLTGVIGELRAGIETLGGRQVVVQQPTAPVVEAQITDEDVDNAINSGQGARAVRALLDRQARDLSIGFDRKLNELAEFGVTAIGNLTAESLKQLPHYTRFKKEIDQKVQAITPAMRANPDTLKLIYNSVVGEHAETLAKEAREEALRQANDGTDGKPVNEIDVRGGGVGKPGAGSPRGERATVPTAEEFAGREGLMALQHKERGKDPDAFAQAMGYQNWNHYIEQYQKLQAENEA